MNGTTRSSPVFQSYPIVKRRCFNKTIYDYSARIVYLHLDKAIILGIGVLRHCTKCVIQNTIMDIGGQTNVMMSCKNRFHLARLLKHLS